ncbi:MAG: helix-turn-helix domain-containing protein, partial [Bacteroidota bacterium]
VIFLTAKNSLKSRIKGLRTGAVSYMGKPFDPGVLLHKVDNILSRNDSLKNKVLAEYECNPRNEKTTSRDLQFLKQLVHALSEGVENPNFKLEQLADRMPMSYSAIYRSCQEYTGKSLVEFYRVLKLKKAALLFLENGYNISQASYMVGYKDTRYFSKCFKDEFGLTPNALKKKLKDDNLDDLLMRYNIKVG